MRSQAGNIFFFLFGAVAVAGVLGVAIQNYVMGPLKTATMVNKRNAADTELQLSLRMMAIAAAGDQANNGDCDADGAVEPLPYADAGVNPHPAGGGILPSTIGGSKRDPWGSDYGYCVWDHGSAVDDAGCGGPAQLRLPGTNGDQWEVIAIISAGPDRIFQTGCNAWADLDANNEPDTPLVNKPAGSDDMYYAWTYAEAANGSGGGLWTLEDLDPDTAEINKNLSVKDGSNVEQLAFDAAARTLTVGTGGAGVFPTLRADYIALMTATNPSIELLDAIGFAPEDATGTSFYLRNPTGDALQITPSSNGAIDGLRLNPGGHVGIGRTPTHLFDVYFADTGTANETVTINGTELRIAPANNQTAGRVQRALRGYAEIAGTNTFAVQTASGVNGSIVNSGTGAVSSMTGIIGYAASQAAANIGTLTGTSGNLNIANGTVTNANGLYSPVDVTGGMITNLHGLRVDLSQTGGTITNRYGVYLNTPVGTATNDWGFYQAGAQYNRLNGRLGIGIDPTVALSVSGDINYSGSLTDTSDRRLKDNIRPLEGSLDKLMMLDGFAFEMKDDEKKQTEYGVMAQDVQKVFPELVHEIDKDGHLGVSYNGLIPPIIEAIKELKAENEKLRAEIEALKKAQNQKE